MLRMLPPRLRTYLSAQRARCFSSRFQFARTPAWRLVEDEFVWERGASQALPGFNLFGYLRGEFGLGEVARAYARAAMLSGIPLSLVDVDLQTLHSRKDQRLQAFLEQRPLQHAIDVVFVNPDNFGRALQQPVPRAGVRQNLLAFWFWELPLVPEAWSAVIDGVDEILVASEYIAHAFRQRTDKPVTKIPYPLFRPRPSALRRSDFGLPVEPFLFLVSFDFNSSIQRKNPAAAIAAFQRAFPPERKDVALLVKSSGGHLNAAGLAHLVALASEDSRIFIRDDVLPVAHVHALQACCDAYVSLHRAEGLGLGLAECMSLGKPVIATRWSGNLEFMAGDDALLVDYQLVPVPADAYPFADGQHWAEPDIEHAAALMRRLADDRTAAAALGAVASTHVHSVLSVDRSAAVLAECLHRITKKDEDGAFPYPGAMW
ncbi:glycosyltransferase [Xanthomonas campestris pv. phormiicola]|nr:glycosyltransferase [Xanthomonas campestris pv. phormiicola]UYC17036.1 glycosyltransferase [Xanthomonas campestris pv. phormiicola]